MINHYQHPYRGLLSVGSLAGAIALTATWVGCSESASAPDGGRDAQADTSLTAADAHAVDAGRDATAGDAAEADGGQPLVATMADVSILYPLTGANPSPAELSAYIPLSAAGAKGTLMPMALFNAVGPLIDNHGDPKPLAPYVNMAVLGMRIDPCFGIVPARPDGVGCQNQIRLVVQPFGGIATQDDAYHLFYSLTRAELTALTKELIQLRQSNSSLPRLGPIQPHPIMKAQGVSGAFGTGLSAIILKYAGASNLVRVTRLAQVDLREVWTFNGFDVLDANAGTVKAFPIATLPPNTLSQLVSRGQDSLELTHGGLTPLTTSVDDPSILFNLASLQGADTAARNRAFTAALRIEDPNVHSPNTIDCGGCHITTPGIKENAEPRFGMTRTGNPLEFKADPRWVTPDEMKVTYTVDIGATTNIHAFSYKGSNAAINQRVVNESAANVSYINQYVLK